jgi:ureidoglycolate lyase
MTGQESLRIEPLTKAAFAPFGDVIELAGAEQRVINQGHAIRYHNLAATDVGADGRSILSIFAAQPWPAPLTIAMLECHPLGSQAFVPLATPDPVLPAISWLVVVALGDAVSPDPGTLRCFGATSEQGVNYRRGTWHHPLLVLAPAQFVVVDRDGVGNNLREFVLAQKDQRQVTV